MAHARLSQLTDWHLVHPEQDVRGWPVQDASGTSIGRVDDLLVSTDTELVEVIRLDDGQEFAAKDIDLGDRVVIVRGAHAETAGTKFTGDSVVKVYGEAKVQQRKDLPEGYATYRNDFHTHYNSQYGSSGQDFPFYEPAYQYGYAGAFNDDYANRDYNALEPTFRSDYERQHGEGTWDRMKDAVKHGYERGRHHRGTRRDV